VTIFAGAGRVSIRSFRHKGLADLFERGRTGKLGSRFHGASLLILDHLDAITSLQDCAGVRGFHALKGDRKGRYAMVVTGNYRITFEWRSGEVVDVDFEDYH